MIAKQIIVTGRVQGVGFRYFVAQHAGQLDVNGIVKNLPDGTVYIEVEGNPERVELLINECYKGPMWAKVTNVDVQEIGLKGYKEFKIVR